MENLPDALNYIRTRYRHPDQRLVNFLEIKLIIRLFSDLLAPGALILDVPSGYGRLTVPLLFKGFRVVGGDISPAMAKLVSEKTLSLNLSIFELPFRDRSFDATLTWRLFHHFDAEEIEKALNELARVSKRFVIFSFYRVNFLHTAERRIRKMKSRIRFYGISQMREILNRTGLEIVLLKSALGPIHAQTICVAKHPEHV